LPYARRQPGRTQIAFAAPALSTNAYYNSLSYDIFVMNTNGTGLQRLTSTPHQDLHPTWKPDGNTIAFSRGIQLVSNPHSGMEHQPGLES
jgi:Tol biopolymer transport system component